MLLRGGDPVLKSETVTEMTRDQLSPDQRSNVWPGSDLLDGRGWGYGVSVFNDGYGWDGGLGTTCSNVPSEELVVVVLTQRAADETGPESAATCSPPLETQADTEHDRPTSTTFDLPARTTIRKRSELSGADGHESCRAATCCGKSGACPGLRSIRRSKWRIARVEVAM